MVVLWGIQCSRDIRKLSFDSKHQASLDLLRLLDLLEMRSDKDRCSQGTSESSKVVLFLVFTSGKDIRSSGGVWGALAIKSHMACSMRYTKSRKVESCGEIGTSRRNNSNAPRERSIRRRPYDIYPSSFLT
ncbi:hypothetical protein G7K_6727-t1 [Saitoella complicata NRRL Y-17804]|uniref:Uncharacterized protein n=1 Tax=Saitoella complicata (strain BCRC 22490 / CBS 7301 / JCM 7358 / NBRC 10748 / NRRL Y-17804) TaxID=698492 RepID=A0A0E9NTB4_SAICN|nr:hypothetical protein G7K_6727-t1 [Saitoella complicata NRRL Y-17804]